MRRRNQRKVLRKKNWELKYVLETKEAKIKEVMAVVADLKKQNEKLKEKIKIGEEKCEKLKEEIEIGTEKCEKLKEEIEIGEEKYENLTELIEKKNTDNKRTLNMYLQLIKHRHEENARGCENCKELTNKVDELNTICCTSKRQIADLKFRNEDLDKKESYARNEVEELEKEIKELKHKFRIEPSETVADRLAATFSSGTPETIAARFAASCSSGTPKRFADRLDATISGDVRELPKEKVPNFKSSFHTKSAQDYFNEVSFADDKYGESLSQGGNTQRRQESNYEGNDSTFDIYNSDCESYDSHSSPVKKRQKRNKPVSILKKPCEPSTSVHEATPLRIDESSRPEQTRNKRLSFMMPHHYVPDKTLPSERPYPFDPSFYNQDVRNTSVRSSVPDKYGKSLLQDRKAQKKPKSNYEAIDSSSKCGSCDDHSRPMKERKKRKKSVSRSHLKKPCQQSTSADKATRLRIAAYSRPKQNWTKCKSFMMRHHYVQNKRLPSEPPYPFDPTLSMHGVRRTSIRRSMQHGEILL